MPTRVPQTKRQRSSPPGVSNRVAGTYHLTDACVETCTFNRDRDGHWPHEVLDALHGKVESGMSLRAVHKWIEEESGQHCARSSLTNHVLRHLVREGGPRDLGAVAAKAAGGIGASLTDLEILDAIIQRGAKGLQSSTIRITPEMTLKAMELRLKLTQGSVFDGFMNAVSEAFGGAENPDAQAAPDEPREIE